MTKELHFFITLHKTQRMYVTFVGPETEQYTLRKRDQCETGSGDLLRS